MKVPLLGACVVLGVVGVIQEPRTLATPVEQAEVPDWTEWQKLKRGLSWRAKRYGGRWTWQFRNYGGQAVTFRYTVGVDRHEVDQAQLDRSETLTTGAWGLEVVDDLPAGNTLYLRYVLPKQGLLPQEEGEGDLTP